MSDSTTTPIPRPTCCAGRRRLSGIARTGLGFTQSLYEKERFEEVLKVAADIRAAAIDEAEADVLFDEWLSTVGEGVAGYVTPKVAVAAVVGNDRGEILLTQRADSGWWLYPVGWADVGYSPSEIAMKEVLEETGIECEPVSLIAVLDGLRLGFARVPMYSLVFHCRMTGGELQGHPLETSAVGFFARDAMPQPLAGRAPLARPRVPCHRRRSTSTRGTTRPATPPGAASRHVRLRRRADRSATRRSRPCRSRVPTRRRSPRGRRDRCDRARARAPRWRRSRAARVRSRRRTRGRPRGRPTVPTSGRDLVAEAQRVRVDALRELRDDRLPDVVVRAARRRVGNRRPDAAGTRAISALSASTSSARRRRARSANR